PVAPSRRSTSDRRTGECRRMRPLAGVQEQAAPSGAVVLRGSGAGNRPRPPPPPGGRPWGGPPRTAFCGLGSKPPPAALLSGWVFVGKETSVPPSGASCRRRANALASLGVML